MAQKGVDFLRLPTIVKTGDSSWIAPNLGLSIEETLKLRSRLIVKAYQKFRPDVVLVDHMPVGALGELKPLLDKTREEENPPKLYLGLRDVLDRPEVIRAVWQATGAYDYLEAYEAVLIYGSAELHDSATIYDLTEKSKRIICCNYVSLEPGPDVGYDRAPESDEPLVLVMGGGGADLFPVAKTYIESLPHLPADLAIRSAIMPGPNMPHEQHAALSLMAGEMPVQVMHGFEDATFWLQQASAVVMMAGYNSVCEVMAWQKKALVIPRPGPSAEQRIRTRLFAERRLIHMLDPDEMTPVRLAESITKLLADETVPDPRFIPSLDGAKRAAAALLES